MLHPKHFTYQRATVTVRVQRTSAVSSAEAIRRMLMKSLIPEELWIKREQGNRVCITNRTAPAAGGNLGIWSRKGRG